MESLPYAVSEDIVILLSQWARQARFALPGEEFFSNLRVEMQRELRRVFPLVDFIPEGYLRERLEWLTRDGFTISSEVYLSSPDFSLEASRLVSAGLEPTGYGSRTEESLDQQVARLRTHLASNPAKAKLMLVDDVMFSGQAMISLVRELQQAGVSVHEVAVGVLIGEGGSAFAEAFPSISLSSACFYPDGVIDEVCERDFYAGLPLSGRLLGGDGLPLHPQVGAPYFLPFGRPVEWASIPQGHVLEWSRFCLAQSIKLWRAIETASRRRVRCTEVPRLPRGIPRDDSSFPNRLAELMTAGSTD